MLIQTEFILPTVSILLTHEPTTGDPSLIGQGVLITEEDTDPDTLTTLEIRRKEISANVYLLWRPESWHLSLSVLYVPETSVLFIGGGTFSATIDVHSMKVVHQHKVLLFWSFQHVPHSILELGEDECFLYNINGELIGSVPVDPPYDVVEQENAVEFVTTLFGVQRLAFPEF
jgi:hypothetical protein